MKGHTTTQLTWLLGTNPFFEGIGCFKNYFIVLNPDAYPIIYNHRKCSIVIKEHINAELDQMVPLSMI